MEPEETAKEPIVASEPPPSYDEASRPNGPLSSESPPSYDKIPGVGRMRQQVKEARETSSNKGTFAVKLCQIVCGSVLCMICLIILAALPVAMIVIGAIYLHRCQGQHIIPIWLIVFGSFSLLQTAINMIKRIFRKSKQGEEEEGSRSNSAEGIGSCLETLISIFLLVWIILGSYWVFGYYSTWSEEGCRSALSMCYCHPVPYLFSFVTLIVIYATSCIFCALCCCIFITIVFACCLT